MSDGVPKSRVTLTYDTKQPQGQQKPRELPFRLMVLGDVGGSKQTPLDERRPRQLNGRNLGEVIKGLKVEVNVPLDPDKPDRAQRLVVDGVGAFEPSDILQLLTGQKAKNKKLDPILKKVWGESETAQSLWQGDAALTAEWEKREQIVDFQNSYQNSKTLRAALKPFSVPTTDPEEIKRRGDAIQKMIQAIDKQFPAAGGSSSKPAGKPSAPAGKPSAPPSSPAAPGGE